MKRIIVRTTRPNDHHRSDVNFDNAELISEDDGTYVYTIDCPRALLAYYPKDWAVEILSEFQIEAE